MYPDQNKILTLTNTSTTATVLGNPTTTIEGLPLGITASGEIVLKVVDVTQVPTNPV